MGLIDGLVSYWTFDGNANDSFGSNNGSGTNVTNSIDYGKINQGYDFNGTNSSITVMDNVKLKPAQITVSCWFNIDAKPTTEAKNFVSKVDSGLTKGYMLYIDNAVFAFFCYGLTGATYASYPTTAYNIETWYHLVGTYDGANIRLYIDGVLRNTSASATGSIAIGTEQLYFGYYPSGSKYYDGKLDEVGIWSRALTSEEISKLYNYGKGLQYPFIEMRNGRGKSSIGAIENVKPASPFSTYGYFNGGRQAAPYATSDRITFSTSTTAANTATNLTTATTGLGGVSDCTLYGYFLGGSTTTYTVAAYKVTYASNSIAANTASNLSEARAFYPSVSDYRVYGYQCGGFTGANVVTADIVTFSSGVTSANTVSNLSQARRAFAGLSDSGTYGYLSGGDSGTYNYVTTTDRITFSSTVTAADTASNLITARYGAIAVSGINAGYQCGGYTGAATAIGEKLNFSSGVFTASTVSNLSQARFNAWGLSGGSTYGYFCGGSTTTSSTAVVTTGDRIAYSTDVNAANTTSNLSLARSQLAGVADGTV